MLWLHIFHRDVVTQAEPPRRWHVNSHEGLCADCVLHLGNGGKTARRESVSFCRALGTSNMTHQEKQERQTPLLAVGIELIAFFKNLHISTNFCVKEV